MSYRVDWIRGLLALAAAIFVLGAVVPGHSLAAPGASSQPRIMILPFQVTGTPTAQSQADAFVRTLNRRIQAKGLAVVPHAEMEGLIERRGITSLDIETVRGLARAGGAGYAVYGSISQIGDSVSVDARLVSAEANFSTRPIFTEQRTTGGSILPAVEELSSRITSQFSQGDALAGVEVRGTKLLDPDVVLLRINTRKGDSIDSESIDREVQRIWELGYFSDVQVDVEMRPDGPYLIYTVVEKPRIEIITVEGASEIDEEDILSVMSNKTGSVLNDSLLAEDITKILELYRKDGYYLATVDYRIDSRQGGANAALILSINEGKRLYIKQVNIDGAEQISASTVRGELLLSERTFISWITGSGVLKEELIERDSAAIASFYLDRGFLDISVGHPSIDYEEDGIVITFPIREGPRYRLGEVQLVGELIDTDERLRSVIELDDMARKGEFFNLSVMQSDTKKLTDFYADYGYAFAEVNPRPQKRMGDAGDIVDIAYEIEKNNKIYVRQVIVEGNVKTRDNVILREMRITDNEPFEGAKLRRSTERLNKLGYFDFAEAELVPTENEDEVDLKIKVKERPTGALMAGIGYSTFSQMGVSGTLIERNVWGKGYIASMQASFSGRRDAYQISLTNPRWDDTPLSVGIDLYHWRDDFWDYKKTTTGGVLRFGYPIGEYTSVGWGYRFDQYKLYHVDDDASSQIKKYADERRYSSVGLLRITRDTTDRERPTNGNIDRIGVEYGGGILQGDDDFISISAEHQTYYQLWPDHILHARIKGAVIFENGSDDIPVFERFWMGGMDSVRGYRSKDLVPRDQKTGDRLGGDRMAFANFEYIWSMSNEVGLNLVPFFDVGFNLDSKQDYNFSDEIVKSFGLELRWRSPMGDLRFSYGIPLDEDRKGNKGSGRFEFSMGQFF